MRGLSANVKVSLFPALENEQVTGESRLVVKVEIAASDILNLYFLFDPYEKRTGDDVCFYCKVTHVCSHRSTYKPWRP